MSRDVLTDPGPLESNYVPADPIDREAEQAAFASALDTDGEGRLQNLHLQGVRGTGKTHLAQLALHELPDPVTTCYVPCTRYDTQYKVLKRLYRAVTGEAVGSGYHPSDLQRTIDDRTDVGQTVVVLDEVDFLLLNDGDDLLYFLSRLAPSHRIGIVTISSSLTPPETQLEQRTYSSLLPRPIVFEPYTAEDVFEMLGERAQQALAPRSLRREALTYIVSSTQNATYALQWLRQAAHAADDAITEELVADVEPAVYETYVKSLLEGFSPHHEVLYRAIAELDAERDSPIRTGVVYDRYQERCAASSEAPLSQRRVSDFLKHLELLDVIRADYQYGGRHGKTREITLTSPGDRLAHFLGR